MKIYIVAFAPSDDSPNGVGGFDWNVSRADALGYMQMHLETEGYDVYYVEKIVPFELGSFISDDVTQWVEKNVAFP